MSDRSKKQMTFFFGAGAEAVFKMPLGAQYTLDTILSKRSQMMVDLKNFYSDRTNDYSSNHVAQFLFTSDSHTFREIVHRAARTLWDCESNMDSDSKRIVELSKYDPKDTVATKKFFEEVKKVFEYAVIDIDKPHDNSKRLQQIKEDCSPYSSLMSKFSYYGSIEKDFSTIINPKEAGILRFWRLINYFWSAYFSIIIPVLDLSLKYINNEEYNKNKYAYVLAHLDDVVKYIYSNEFYIDIDKIYQSSYYGKLKQAFPDSNVITTNYTPFLEFAKFEETIFLAGKLSQFEIPEELKVVDISGSDNSCENIKSKFIFPYMSTQSPLKPIVDSVQLREYSKLIEILDNTETLVIIGYNINDNDNHINALLRNFLIQKPTNRILFFQYVKEVDDFDQKKTLNDVAKKLRVTSNAVKNQILTFPNYGKADEILSKLRD